MCVLHLSCKPKQNSNTSLGANSKKTSITLIEAFGKVSHSYKTSGCGSVIILIGKSSKDSLILIPRQIPNEFDKDGLKISFNYRILRMPNPIGCGTGVPAEVSNIFKK